jgi:hypothetical protein
MCIPRADAQARGLKLPKSSAGGIDGPAATLLPATVRWRRMRASLALLAALLPLAALAGCVGDVLPDESTEPPASEVDDPLVDPPPVTPTAEPTPTTPTDDGIVIGPAPTPEAPASAAPTPESTPPPVAPPPEPTPPPADPTPPPPTPPAPDDDPEEPDPDVWPREGSTVTVRGTAGESFPSTFDNSSEWTATWTFEDGDWRGECEGSYEHDWDEGISEEDTSGTFRAEFTASDPPHWPLFNTRDVPDVGDEIEVWIMWDCDIRQETMIYSGIENGFHTADDTQEAEENYSDFNTRWDPETGLVLDWSWSRSHSGSSGTVETDAPGL